MKLQVAAMLVTVTVVLHAGSPGEAPAVVERFRVPDGFAVELVAPPDLTGSLIAMTFDSAGRLVVSKERGHPTILLDRDGDGLFETEQVFSDRVMSAQGLWFDGPTLYAVGMGVEEKKPGLYRMTDAGGDGRADTFERVILFRGEMGEHGPHALRRGPDGSPYLMLGNHAWMPDELKHPASPLRHYDEYQLLPRYMDARGHAVDIMAPGGTVWRLDPEGGRHVLVAGGFRNAYDHAFNLEGELFTFDSDMEWDIGLPWFRDVRSVHVVPGGEYGWRTGSGKWPDYYLDSLPPLREVGRGSPVGVEFYQHHVYPEHYVDAYLEGDWSRGRILASTLARSGATYRLADPSHDFVYGEPLNVTDLEVGPDGFVYFVTGGRNTEGGVYRVAYRRDPAAGPATPDLSRSGVPAVVRQPQPLSSWGHASLQRIKEEMGDGWARDLERVARDVSALPRDRTQALLLLQRFGPEPSGVLLEGLMHDPVPDVRSAVIYVAGQQKTAAARAVAAGGLRDADPFVRRRAAEALLRIGVSRDAGDLVSDLLRLTNDDDRFVRYAARLVLEQIDPERWRQTVLGTRDPSGAAERLLALVRLAGDDRDLGAPLERLVELLGRQDLQTKDTLRLLRVLHMTFIRLQNAPGPAVRQRVHDLVSVRFPAADDRLNAEYARTLAYIGRPAAIAQILAAMPEGDDRRPLQIHYVYCLRAIQEGWTAGQKEQMLAWFGRSQQWRGGASFQGYINRLFDSALEFFSPPERTAAYERFPDYAPLDEAIARKLAGSGGFQPARVFARRGWGSGLTEQELLEYLLYDPMTLRADPERGRAVYEKALCASCHRFGDVGIDLGPDLTTIASRFTRRDMIEATLWPSRTISDQYAAVEVTTRDGTNYIGTVASEDADHVHLQVAGLGRPVAIAKASIASRKRSEISTMPAGLLDNLNLEEIADLFAFLETGR